MKRAMTLGSLMLAIIIFFIFFGGLVACGVENEATQANNFIELFDGRSLNGWKASENAQAWRVENGCLVADGKRSHLFYVGPVGNHNFKNFELEAEVLTQHLTDSGIYFHTAYQETGWPGRGYEVQINNTHNGIDGRLELKRTGSLYGVRNNYQKWLEDGRWFHVSISVIGKRIRVWVNGYPVVDYLESAKAPRAPGQSQRRLSRGTIALQGHDPDSCVAYRNVKIRLLPDDADSALPTRASTEGYGIDSALLDKINADSIPVIDYHIHLRGGMTLKKAMERQAMLGINSGVLKNIGSGWPIETDAQLCEHLDSVVGKPVFVGVQVNDRDWMEKHSPELLKRLDFVLADTMIMPMPNDDSKPVKLWQTDKYTISDAKAWMKRYMRHNLRVLAEPITILANPTYLPAALADKYDQLWTDDRMKTIIQAAIDNNVALEINASSGLPSDRFVRLAKKMGAKFCFGSNNFDDKPINMKRCLEVIERFGLTKEDIYVAGPKPRDSEEK
ncbi:MAG: DUF1080 domain-containing protein [Pirellulales bacterium]|nr:DUF1080 domain-containing protein [Pirellulales bacterium]